jgi:hypothetical protein
MDMDLNNDFFRPWLQRQWCWDNGYYVDVIPAKRGVQKCNCRLNLRLGKNIKKGTEEYKQSSLELEQKINELYEYMYNNFYKD